MADKNCSLIDYSESLKISAHGYSFYGMVEALKAIAEDDNIQCVNQEWPTAGRNWDFEDARQIVIRGHSFYGVLGALVRKADTANLHHIQNGWPTFCDQFVQRYNAPGGRLEGD